MNALHVGQCGCARPMMTLTGTVTSATGPVANALLRYTSGAVSATTYADAQGRYSLQVSQGSTVTITPEAGLGVTVTPPTRTIGPVCAAQTGLDFVYSPLTPPGTFTLSGTLSGPPGTSGTVSYTINGVAGSVATDTLGNYAFTVPAGATVLITPPVIAGQTPSPATIALNNVQANTPNLNFAYSAAGLTVSGAITNVPGNVPVTVAYTINGVPGSTVSNPAAGGAYSITVPSGATVFVAVPIIGGAEPNPPSRLLTNVTTNMPNQNFVYGPPALTVSGLLTGPLGAALAGIEILYSVNGQLRTTNSDATGNFALDVAQGDRVVIELVPPSGFMVNPTGIVIDNVQGNLPNQNFALSIDPATTAMISGTLSGAIDPVFQPLTARINGGAPITLLTNMTGQYLLPVPLGASVVIEPPVILGRTATPPSYTLTNVMTDLPGRDFVYTA